MREYELVSEYYGTQCAKRSGVPLINHIDEGLKILEVLESPDRARRAWCLHPLLQSDSALLENYRKVCELPGGIVLLAMEYRYRANAWLSSKVAETPGGRWKIEGSPVPGNFYEVRHMLIADKVQNYKDFLKHHRVSHPRSEELIVYFHAWFEALHVTTDNYHALIEEAGIS